MNKNRGFTLIELICVIVLISLTITIGFNVIINIIDTSKNQLYEEQVSRIIKISKNWAIENVNKLPSEVNDKYQISIQKLIDEEYLNNKDIIDARDNSKIDGCIEITYNSSNNYDYTYVSKENCYDEDTIYTITYDLDGGTLEKENPINYKNSTSTFVLNNPKKNGYYFVGWEDLSNPGVYNLQLKIKIGSKGNKNYKAIWSQEVYTLTINPNGGIYNNKSDNSIYEVMSNSNIQLDIPIRDGYVFKEWSIVAGDAEITDNILSLKQENVVLTAIWSKLN